MDSNSLIEAIRSQVASDIRLSPTDDRLRIGTPLVFDDGDNCSFFLVERDDQLVLSDLGDVFTRADYEETDLHASGHKNRFQRLMDFYGLREIDGEIMMEVRRERMGDAIFSFAQAALELVKLARTPSERKRRAEKSFRAKVGKLVRAIVPSDRLEENWHDPRSDPNRYYQADFRILGTAGAWCIFGVGTGMKALRATVSCQHFRLSGEKLRSAAIYKDETTLPKSATAPLDEVVDKSFASFSERDSFASFIEREILA